jgi:hypothetical protein
MSKEDLNEPELELFGVELFQLALVIWRARLKGRHNSRYWKLLGMQQ